jgi:hypothetical protein
MRFGDSSRIARRLEQGGDNATTVPLPFVVTCRGGPDEWKELLLLLAILPEALSRWKKLDLQSSLRGLVALSR